MKKKYALLTTFVVIIILVISVMYISINSANQINALKKENQMVLSEVFDLKAKNTSLIDMVNESKEPNMEACKVTRTYRVRSITDDEATNSIILVVDAQKDEVPRILVISNQDSIEFEENKYYQFEVHGKYQPSNSKVLFYMRADSVKEASDDPTQHVFEVCDK